MHKAAEYNSENLKPIKRKLTSLQAKIIQAPQPK